MAKRLKWLATLPRRGGLLVRSLLRSGVDMLMASCCLSRWVCHAVLSFCSTMILASPAWRRSTSGKRRGAKARMEACEAASQAALTHCM
eukprot:4368312-Alexandrium_andersonii.AAC.1